MLLLLYIFTSLFNSSSALLCIVSLVVNISRYFPHSWLITGFVTILTRRVSLVEQELLTLPEHQSSPPVLSGIRVTRSLVLYVCFVDRLSFCTFSFGHCVVCPLVSSSSSSYYLKDFYNQIIKTLLRRPFDNVNNNYHCWKKEYAFELFGFPIFWPCAYLMKVIPEMCYMY